MTTTRPALPLIVDEVEVVSVERLSPTYVRVELGGPALVDFGVDGPLLDLRIKLLFPNDAGRLPSLEGIDESWFSTWLTIPEAERGHLRTYTVRAVRSAGPDTRLVVDFVLHLEDGATGPGSAWAARATRGDRLVTVAPRKGMDYGGIEFDPGTARELLLVADETAVPAVCSILEDLPQRACGAALLEVPVSGDVREQPGPPGVEVVWLPRDGEPLGSLLDAEVRRRLGATVEAVRVNEVEVDPDLWETSTYSSSGQDVDAPVATVGHDLDGMYAWIAGESAVVTSMRRLLVTELGMDRRQVAFMGYWRRGVAMRS